MKANKRICTILTVMCLGLTASAQRFFNLTADEVRVDSVLPRFAYSIPLEGNYRDSTYTATIRYPEFAAMTPLEVENYHAITHEPLPAMPRVDLRIAVDRKRGALEVRFCPLVCRNGRYEALVSFMLSIESQPKQGAAAKRAGATRARAAAGRYAEQSMLASGKWAKIRIPETGVYQLTNELIRKAGFSDPNKVKIYGYGGNLQNEKLVGTELQALDDLKEVPTCRVGNKRLFHGKGPVSWADNKASRRTRNPYSDYGYYFLTESNEAPMMIDSAAFVGTFYPSPDYYHTLHETDGYSWYHGGRNLYDPKPLAEGQTISVTLNNEGHAKRGELVVVMSAGTAGQVEVMRNDQVLGTLKITRAQIGELDYGCEVRGAYQLDGLADVETVKIRNVAGGPFRTDFVSMTWDSPAPPPQLSKTTAIPEYVYNITNQNHHADGPADMVIIIPTSQKLLPQAQRLADFHIEHDSMRVRIVPADELYNEFSSGTPDANAYRRYLKMLYDRAEREKDMPKYLVLFGNSVWDCRMLTSDCKNLNPDDYLLCFESENSMNKSFSYVDDGFFCLLDDGEGADPQSSDKLDMAVGRFPVSTPEEAKVMVDKTISYVRNANAGAWQNVLVFMGDDGDNNLHMEDINKIADDIAGRHPGFLIKKVMWDAYRGVSTSTGNTYPEVTRIIKKQQEEGALVMNYSGHGREDQISHENVLSIKDFESFKNKNLPLWITASCDIMPFDNVKPNIGVAAVLNPQGGAVAFFGTTRTVYANYSRQFNMAYMRMVLSRENGKPMTLGEAQRRAKNQMITSGEDRTTNKLQYSLLGDPALALKLPSLKVVVDTINGTDVAQGNNTTQLRAGDAVRVSGHIEHGEGFNGIITAVVRDARQLITGNENVSAETKKPMTFYDRTNVLYNGADSVRNGKFSFTFAVPKDISYANDNGLMNLYAVNADHTRIAHGSNANYNVGGTGETTNDSVGPKIFCYLNTPEFENGGRVNVTPYFVARLSDKNGINVTGSGVGHDLTLVVDGDASKTYVLNEHFKFDFGTYTSGTVAFSLPQLEPGKHRLMFRAWDVQNNSSTATLNFTVVKALAPSLQSVIVYPNPASSAAQFIIHHNISGCRISVAVDVLDVSGRLLWTHSETGVSAEKTYTVDWDLRQDSGSKLQTGVYLYRVRMSADGSSESVKSGKLIVIGNK